MEKITEPNIKREAFDEYIDLLKLTDEDLSKSLLDVGAGTGQFISFLRNELGNRNAYGVDDSKDKVFYGGQEGMVIGDGFKLPFSDGQFEIVISKNYLPIFVDDEEKMQESIQELLRVTAPGGRIVSDISTPDDVLKSLERFSKLESHDEKSEMWFRRRHVGAEKLLVYLDSLRDGVEVKRDGGILTIFKK